MAVCTICHTPTDERLLALAATLTAPAAALGRQLWPHWQPAHGLCPHCALHLMRQLAAQRSATSLHTQTSPPTTFPYYAPAEETVLSQPDRLADYPQFPGHGVTIAFLDSGYYPHPDLMAGPGDALLGDVRLVHYVDLTDHGEREGLDTPSLWDGAGDSWHGQMTTAVAAGSGALSDGHFRGFAPAASVLPIKIGRGGGRIPEEDILRGLQWLLRDDNWQRWGVRVVNISVGGDFPEDWQNNAVCRAAHALAQRGVLVAAAAGNRGVEELLAPAQTPTVLTVGGVDDHNRRWRPTVPAEVGGLSLYHHNYGSVPWQHTLVRKPEILALGRWVPSPVLPPSPVYAETEVIARLRLVLAGSEPATWTPDEEWMPEVWQAVRRRMNAHKWVHPYYQHVDGTSVAVAQVSAVAAQMLEANPRLIGDDLRRLLIETALPLPHLLSRQTGPGLLQPALAVAAALRAPGGVLAGFPRSGVRLRAHELQKWVDQGRLAVLTLDGRADPGNEAVYLGCWAPHAGSVSVIGSFNQWRPGELPLHPAGNGWQHVALRLPPGAHLYRFWIEADTQDRAAVPGLPLAEWRRDAENPDVVESGYREGHSAILVEPC